MACVGSLQLSAWRYRRRRQEGTRSRCRSSCALLAVARYPEARVSAEVYKVEKPIRAFFLNQCPPEDPRLPEIAVFGRSNVGKSSLVNFICGRKLLSTVSKHPGHTRLVHHFLVDKSWYLVDLPGIGHADAKVSQLKAMDRIVAAYVRHRSTLIELLYLVDASLPPKPIDLRGIKWLTDAGVHLSVVFTKTDKPPTGQVHPGGPAEALSDALLDMHGSPFRLGIRKMPQMMLTSTTARVGREVVLEHIADLRRRCRPRAQVGVQQDRKILRGAATFKVQETTRAGAPPAIR